MSWAALPLESWRDTRDTLQMWMQIAGKICLARTPRVNHFWNIAFQITPRGLSTPAMPVMPHAGRTFTGTQSQRHDQRRQKETESSHSILHDG